MDNSGNDELWDHYSGLPNPMWYQHTKETKDQNSLYSEIESLIIHWTIDGTKTAGSLTREIMELIKNSDEN